MSLKVLFCIMNTKRQLKSALETKAFQNLVTLYYSRAIDDEPTVSLYNRER